jgi:hypothetical protein
MFRLVKTAQKINSLSWQNVGLIYRVKLYQYTMFCSAWHMLLESPWSLVSHPRNRSSFGLFNKKLWLVYWKLLFLRLVKWFLLNLLLCALWLLFGCTVLCEVALDYGSTVVQRSSWSLRGFGFALLVAWSHPTYVRYKASYPMFVTRYLCSFDLLS